MIQYISLIHNLEPGECVEADNGSEDPDTDRAPGSVRFMEDVHWHRNRANTQRRHETINQRVKVYGILTQRFRYDYIKYSMCF